MTAESNRKGRPQQPKCTCGKALYKRMDAGPVTTSDPYGWCRNQECKVFGTDQSGTSRFGGAKASPAPAKPPPKKEEKKAALSPPSPVNVKSRKATIPRPAEKPVVKSAIVPVKGESDEITEARKTIAKVMSGDGAYQKNALGVCLALLCQRIGSHDAANSLIVEFDLEAKYGIKPLEVSAPKKGSKKP